MKDVLPKITTKYLDVNLKLSMAQVDQVILADFRDQLTNREGIPENVIQAFETLVDWYSDPVVYEPAPVSYAPTEYPHDPDFRHYVT